MRKYRKVVREKNSKLQNYQVSMFVLFFLILLLFFSFILLFSFKYSSFNFEFYVYVFILFLFILITFTCLILIFYWRLRDRTADLNYSKMSGVPLKFSRKMRRLFNDKNVVDVLKLSNKTRYGIEIPEIFVYFNSDLYSGYIAIENIANFDSLDRVKIEQRISGILNGKFQKYSIVSSELIMGDSWVLYHFEDLSTSMRLVLNDEKDVVNFISENTNDILLAKDLTWHVNIIPHLAVVARTRSGKSLFCGGYLAPLMKAQGWMVEYNSAKKDIYVKRYDGKFEVIDIVERAEYWLSVMRERLVEIDKAGVEKYTDLSMQNIAIFFDEIGNLNAFLQNDKLLKSRWELAINALLATGASAGLHIISISQRATREGFLTGLAKTNSSDAVIMLGNAASEATERQYLIPGFEIVKRNYSVGQGIAKFDASGRKWQEPHFFETPLFKNYV